jgi:nucleotide-binding universal stress UspA family protein
MKSAETSSRIALHNVLFATDFSPCSNAALPYAVSIARQYGAKLCAAHVVSSLAYLAASPEVWPTFDQQEQQRIREVEDLEKKLQGIPHSVLTRTGNVWEALARLVRENEIDLLVVGTHGRTGFQKLLMGSVAEEIFRKAYCPVLTVGPNVRFTTEAMPQFKKILFATDFSKESLAALPYAISFAEEHDARLSLLHILEQPAVGSVDLESNAAFLLSRLRELVPPGTQFWCHPQSFVEYGVPADRILDFAQKMEADLIVLGVRPSGAGLDVSTHLARNTAHKIVAHASCPVLTVHG